MELTVRLLRVRRVTTDDIQSATLSLSAEKIPIACVEDAPTESV